MKYSKYLEFVYVIVAILSVVEVYTQWSEDRDRAYLFIFFACVAIFMFFFKRHFRRKFAQRQNDDKS